MKNPTHRTTNYASGFTLIELLVVIGIISLLASLIFLATSSAREKGRIAQVLRTAHELANAVALYDSDLGFYPPDMRTGWDPGLQESYPTDYGAGWRKMENIYPNCADPNCPAQVKSFANWDTYIKDTVTTRWKGPYHTAWPQKTPWQGGYDYNYWPASIVPQGFSGLQRCAVSGSERICCETPPGIYIGIQPNTNEGVPAGTGMIPNEAEKAIIAKGADAGNNICYTSTTQGPVTMPDGTSGTAWLPGTPLAPTDAPNGEVQILVTPL